MARARNIKPGFFKNEILAECSPLARILFTGLWCEADREGRMEYRPKRIKVAVLPYDDCVIDDLITELEQKGFVLRYEVGGKRYLEVCNFRKHQQPHHKEVKSVIPAPDQTASHAQSKHAASMDQEQPEKIASCPTDSLNLIPDSLNRIADSQASPRKRGSRLPKPLTLTDEWRKEAVRLGGLVVSIDGEFAKFCDHWWAKSGKDATKDDWLATWRNWIRRACEYAPRSGVAEPSKPPPISKPSCSLCVRASVGRHTDGASYCERHMPKQAAAA